MNDTTPPLPSPSPPRRWLLPAILLLALIAAGWTGWHWWAGGWRPDIARWPMQGVAVGASNTPLDWPALVRAGANFAYIDASGADAERGARFTAQHGAAREAGLRVGAIHHFAICALASEQAAAFVQRVPREASALPPAVMLDIDPACSRRPTRALLLTELTTFLTQVETHLGKAAVVSPSDEIEDEYRIAEAVNRALWLRSNLNEPEADAPAWVIWQANDAFAIDGAEGRVRWLVANDGGPWSRPDAETPDAQTPEAETGP